MQLSRPAKVVLGVLTVLPALYVVAFAILVARLFFQRAMGDAEADLPLPIGQLMWAHLAVMVLIAALLTYYVAYVMRSGRIPPEERARWVFALLVVNVAAMPLFFARHVWPAPRR